MAKPTAKTTSYRDLLQRLQKADQQSQTLHTKSLHRPLYLKKHSNHKLNKQNCVSKNHIQSLHEKSVSQKSEWVEEDVLKQYSQKRKERQIQLTHNKFIAYITQILTNLTGAVPPSLLTNKLTYLQYLAALNEMCFIKQTYQPSHRNSVSQLWSQLGNNGQTVGNFIIFIANILNLKKNEDQNNRKFAHLFKKYADFRFTRMQLQGKVKTILDQEQYPFTPVISQRTRTLAPSRSKSKDKKDRNLAQKSYHQLLEYSAEPQVQNDQTHRHSHGLSQPLEQFLGNRRSQILYKLAKQKSLEKRRDKKSSQVQYQKSIKELTFHPKIHPISHNKEKTAKKYILGEKDSIDRMIRGRIERQVRKVIQEKGLPYNEKMFQKMKKDKYLALEKQKQQATSQEEKHKLTFQLSEITNINQRIQQAKAPQVKTQKEPIVLLIQVAQGHCQKLIIDNVSQYKQAAAKFIKDYNLKAEMYEKLVQGVQNALKFQLTPINEAPYESEYESID